MHQMRISTNQVFPVMPRSQKFEIKKKKKLKPWKADRNRTEYNEIEPNPSKDRAMHEGDNSSFWDEFMKFTLFFTVQFNSYFKASTEVLRYWTVETLGG
jgi:hypothetical protein